MAWPQHGWWGIVTRTTAGHPAAYQASYLHLAEQIMRTDARPRRNVVCSRYLAPYGYPTGVRSTGDPLTCDP